jgi:PHD/YefM family antitoxin component YafN of YafNO toxin-antitoxin module
MGMQEISSREFAAEPLKVKQMARSGPVIVTNRGEPELVILRYERWRTLVPQDVPEDLLDALADDVGPDTEFMVPRIELEPRPVDLDEP